MLFPVLMQAQVTTKYGVSNNIPYVFYDNPNTKLMVVITQGVGEYATSLDPALLPNSKINTANTYATYASRGKVYPFDILVAQSYKPATVSQPMQTYLMQGLTSLIKSFEPTKVIGTGYSYGGQLLLGFYLNCIIGGKNAFVGNEIFDGYVIMDAKAPGTPDYCHNNKPSILICATGGIYYYPLRNVEVNKVKACPDQQDPVFYSIAGGSHYTSWEHGYDINSVEGKSVLDFITSFEEKKTTIECTATLDEANGVATFHLPEGDITYHIGK